MANSVDPDQMPHSVASDLGLYCLSVDIALDKMFFFNPKVLIFFLFLHENICCGYSLE